MVGDGQRKKETEFFSGFYEVFPAMVVNWLAAFSFFFARVHPDSFTQFIFARKLVAIGCHHPDNSAVKGFEMLIFDLRSIAWKDREEQ